tara:strand:- start:740 stop:1009 length:270 start_codon:yes stop_codon:yes gene_type:complete
MSLVISRSEEVFYLNGVLNSSTLNYFTNYFNSNLGLADKVMLNIDNVVEFDNSALSEIKDLARTTILNQNAFSIVGNGCKQICESFNQI